MKRIGLLLEFDGTGYAGWQRQPNGLSIQELVENALAQVVGIRVVLHFSGRTDAGVHARGMVACFLSPRDLPVSAYREGVNRHLPPEIAVREAWESTSEFNPRHDALGKWYRYTIYNGMVRSPLVSRTSWHIRGRLDEALMNAAAGAFVGRHDFSAFRAAGCEAGTTVRDIFDSTVSRQEELLYFDVHGGGFLRNMVRIMAGTLMEIGLGRRPADDVARLLSDGVRNRAGRTAPPQGLCLMEVWFGEGAGGP